MRHDVCVGVINTEPGVNLAEPGVINIVQCYEASSLFIKPHWFTYMGHSKSNEIR